MLLRRVRRDVPLRKPPHTTSTGKSPQFCCFAACLLYVLPRTSHVMAGDGNLRGNHKTARGNELRGGGSDETIGSPFINNTFAAHAGRKKVKMQQSAHSFFPRPPAYLEGSNGERPLIPAGETRGATHPRHSLSSSDKAAKLA